MYLAALFRATNANPDGRLVAGTKTMTMSELVSRVLLRIGTACRIRGLLLQELDYLRTRSMEPAEIGWAFPVGLDIAKRCRRWFRYSHRGDARRRRFPVHGGYRGNTGTRSRAFRSRTLLDRGRISWEMGFRPIDCSPQDAASRTGLFSDNLSIESNTIHSVKDARQRRPPGE